LVQQLEASMSQKWGIDPFLAMNMSRHKSLVPQLVKRLPRQSSLRRIKVFTSVTIRVLQSSSIHLRATCHQIQRYQLRSQSTTTYAESLTMSSTYTTATIRTATLSAYNVNTNYQIVSILGEFQMRSNMAGHATRQIVFFKEAVEHIVR